MYEWVTAVGEWLRFTKESTSAHHQDYPWHRSHPDVPALGRENDKSVVWLLNSLEALRVSQHQLRVLIKFHPTHWAQMLLKEPESVLAVANDAIARMDRSNMRLPDWPPRPASPKYVDGMAKLIRGGVGTSNRKKITKALANLEDGYFNRSETNIAVFKEPMARQFQANSVAGNTTGAWGTDYVERIRLNLDFMQDEQHRQFYKLFYGAG